jgi:hypothetical protein
MQKILSFLILMYLLPQFTFCQTAIIKGKLADSTNNEKPANAVVSVLRQKDSTLVKFSRSDKNGNFQVADLKPGKYLVLITYPKYGDYIDHIDLKASETYDFKTIYLTQKAKLLEAIIIRQSAMRLKGDTTEFTADSFHVKPNANVEDLLKELPGIQVDKDGKITAQGQQVQKILVDGDEFFSDDPTVATRNLRADAIDKVQVFDKKSDQATFTGIDDGEKTKTINLKLKENAKHGYFGKLSAGALDKYYNGQAMINAFKSKRKISAFAVTSSTDQTGLNWNDSRNYGFDNTNIEFGDGTIMITKDATDDLGAGNSYGQGLPESIKAGLHFSNKWDNDKYNANGNYVFNKMNTFSRGNSYIQNILADSVYYNRDAAETHSNKLRHTASGVMEIQMDSSSSIKVNAFGSTGISTSSSTDNSQALSQENKLVNSGLRNSSSNGDNNSFNSTVLWRKKFKKKGRTISVSFNERYTGSDSKGFLNNRSDFYDNAGDIFRTDTTDQNKVNVVSQNIIGAKATYTEPISKTSFLEFNYSYYNNSSNQKIESYNKDVGGKYSMLVDSLSNDFKYIYNTNTAGVSYLYNGKKIISSFGGNIANTAFQQTDLVKDTTRKSNYYNFFPRANFRYKFSSFSNLSINYNGSTSQPTIDQIQPLKNNSDPLNIIVGNPDLKQQFSNNFNLNYNNYQVLNQRYIYAGGNVNFVKDQISSSYTIDSLGKRTSKYVNVDGNYSASFYGGIGMKIPKTQISINVGPNISFSKYGNYVNGLKNVTNSTNISTRFSARTNKKNVFELSASIIPSYSISKSSISTVAGTNYWAFDYSLNGSYQLPWKLEIGSDIDFNLRQKIKAFDRNNNVILWNAYLEKKFLKNDMLTLRASINDILDQNKGYSRNIQPNAIVERNYLTLGRYGLITLSYNFNNKGGSAAPKGMIFR